jgi:hypothetical protein
MKKESEDKFINPFDGAGYDEFLKAKGGKSVAEYCKGKLTENQIEILQRELEK